MQNNYYFLRKFTEQLANIFQVPFFEGLPTKLPTLADAQHFRVGTCFSQTKDELLIGCFDKNQDIYLRATLFTDFSCLSTLQEFHRAKRNSVELFVEILDKAIIALTQFRHERAFALHLSDDFHLIFKMHGRRANVLLFAGEEFVRSFHKKMENDQFINWQQLDRKLDISFERFEQLQGNLMQFLPTLGKEVQDYLFAEKYAQLPIQEQWQLLGDFVKKLENPTQYYLIEKNNIPELFLFQPNTPAMIVYESSNPLETVNQFFFSYTRYKTLYTEKNAVLKLLDKQIKKTESYIQKHFERLATITDNVRNEEIANILMANLHQVPARATQVQLFDFYHNQDINIKLKETLSPQKNAEVYYRKAKNEKIEREKLEQNIAQKEKELQIFKQHRQIIENIDTIKALRQYLKEYALTPNPKHENSLPELFRTFQYQGFEILVGRNAKNNDLLTQNYAKKDDLWLHAKDVSGSHVIIKHKAGQPFPKDVIEKAASLAAYYSKRSQDSLCPVIYTPKKYVRKTRDLHEGQVIVEKEQVLMVIPERF